MMPVMESSTVYTGAPQQYKQSSRKGKKAWRKNVDVTDIQNGLDQVRAEVIKGGIIIEKESLELFRLDTTGDIGIAKKHLRCVKPLKADEIIGQRSAIPAILHPKRPGWNDTDEAVDIKRQRVSYVSYKDLTRLRNIADGNNTEISIIEGTDPAFDLWNEERDIASTAHDLRFPFLPKAKKKRAPETLQHRPISLAASGKLIPAVRRPEGGYSYNPMFSEYEERLILEGEREVEAEQKRLACAEAERVKHEAIIKSAAEAVAAEAKAELSEWDEDSAWEGFESGAEDARLNAKRPERKTQAQRNRIKRRKEEERKLKIAADIKKKDEQAAKVKNIAKALRAKENARALPAIADDSESNDGNDFELRRRKFGKTPLPERQLELVLPDELQESLRLLKPEGNLLKDRYRSMVVRGRIESRRPIAFHKQAKRKATEKWTHKDFMLH